VIEDGTGARFIRERCGAQPFQVCQYADRLPIDADHFLWGQTPKTGVFDTLSTPERRALSTQDARFALAAAKTYPAAQVGASLRNAALQTLDTDLSDFDYKPSLRDGYLHTLPPTALARAQATMAWRETWPIGAIWALQGLVALVSIAVIGWSFAARGQGEAFAAARTTGGLMLLGVLANGAMCGVFSSLYGRYQARVEWLLPLAAMLLIAATRRGSRP
jgi:hypothetical protein